MINTGSQDRPFFLKQCTAKNKELKAAPPPRAHPWPSHPRYQMSVPLKMNSYCLGLFHSALRFNPGIFAWILQIKKNVNFVSCFLKTFYVLYYLENPKATKIQNNVRINNVFKKNKLLALRRRILPTLKSQLCRALPSPVVKQLQSVLTWPWPL